MSSAIQSTIEPLILAPSMVTPCSQPSTNNEPTLEALPNSLMEPIVNEELDSNSGGFLAACEGVASEDI